MAMKKSEPIPPSGPPATNCAAAWIPGRYRLRTVLLFINSLQQWYRYPSPIADSRSAQLKDIVALKGKPDISNQINKKMIEPLADELLPTCPT